MSDKPSSPIEKKGDGTIVFEMTIPWGKVEEAYKKAVEHAKKNLELKGFRKGKAPDKLVEEHLGKQKLYTQSLEYLLPDAYAQSVADLKLKPITSPRIETKSLEEGKDWVLTVTIAEKPEINLGDYKKVVSGAKAAGKLWIPGKGDEKKGKGTDQKETINAQLKKIFETLLEHVKLIVPEYIIEEQVNHELSHLIEQLQRLGLTIDQYVASIGKSPEKLKDEYRKQAEQTVKLEFIMNEIAKDMNITVFEEEVDQLIDAVGDEKVRQRLKQSGSERASIRESLRKRKVTDALLKL